MFKQFTETNCTNTLQKQTAQIPKSITQPNQTQNKTQQTQSQNKINYATKSITQQNQVQTAQTQNQRNNKTIQYQLRINSIPTQDHVNVFTIIVNSIETQLNHKKLNPI